MPASDLATRHIVPNTIVFPLDELPLVWTGNPSGAFGQFGLINGTAEISCDDGLEWSVEEIRLGGHARSSRWSKTGTASVTLPVEHPLWALIERSVRETQADAVVAALIDAGLMDEVGPATRRFA